MSLIHNSDRCDENFFIVSSRFFNFDNLLKTIFLILYNYIFHDPVRL